MRDILRYVAAGIALLTVAPLEGRAQTLVAAPMAVQKQMGLTNEETRLSYALGVIFGTGMQHDGFKVDVEVVSRGIQDGMAATNLMAAQNQARGVLADYRKEMDAKEVQERLELARQNREQGKRFCETNAYREGVSALPSGLQFRVLKSGEGPWVDPKMIVKTIWRGTLIDGTEFQDTRKQLLGSEFDFEKQQVIAGLKEALPLMHVGDRWELVLPPDIAYGNAGYLNGIPPGATLIYDLEVAGLEFPLADLITGASSVSADASSVAAPDTTKLK